MRRQNSLFIAIVLAVLTQVWNFIFKIWRHFKKNVIFIQIDAGAEELKVQCSRSGLTVHVKFDSPFYGIVYSQNYYQVPQCTYVDNGQGRTSFR